MGNLLNCCCCRGEEDDEEIQKRENEKLDKGPLENRRCKDILWLIVFIAFNIFAFVIAGWAYDNGEPERLIYGMDSFGNICGQDNTGRGLVGSTNYNKDLSGVEFLYYLDPTDTDTLKLCVTSCHTGGSLDCGATGGGTDAAACQTAGLCMTGNSNYDADGGTQCAPVGYDSSAKFGLHICIPDAASGLVDDFYSRINEFGQLEEIFEDFAEAWQEIVYCLLIAFGLSLVLTLCMRCLAGPLIYGFILAAVASLVALCVFLWVTYKDLNELDLTLDNNRRNRDLALALSITVTIVTVILLIILIALRNRIKLAVAIMKVASKAIARMPQMVLSPILTYIALGCFFAFWITVFLYLVTTDDVNADTTTTPSTATLAQHDFFIRAWWYHLFTGLWGTQFILACQEFVLASAFATWYFTRDKSTMLRPYGSGIWRMLRYHLGSLAAGSLIIAIIQLVRIILAYIDYKLNKHTDSRLAQFLLRCLQCCLWCFEKCMKFLNKNAYIEIAIFGYSFCAAAMQAFKVLLSNAARVAVLNSVTAMILFVIKLLVVAITGIAAILWLRDDVDLNFYYIVVLVICIGAWLIAGSFLDVYDMAVDTIFIAFCEDSNRNNGKDKPYFMPNELLKALGEKGASNSPPEYEHPPAE